MKRSDWMSQAIGFHDSGDWHALNELCGQWVGCEQDSGDALFYSGMAKIGLNEYEQAIEDLKRSLAHNQKHAVAWHNLGWAHYQLKSYQEAINAFRQSLEIEPDLFLSWLRLGGTYRLIEENNLAIECYKNALKIDQNSSTCWWLLGEVYIEMEWYKRAVKALEKSIELYPEEDNPWYNLGYAYDRLGQHDSAIPAFREALKYNPEHTGALYCLGTACIMNYQLTDAIDTAKNLEFLDPSAAGEIYTGVEITKKYLFENDLKEVVGEDGVISAIPEGVIISELYESFFKNGQSYDDYYLGAIIYRDGSYYISPSDADSAYDQKEKFDILRGCLEENISVNTEQGARVVTVSDPDYLVIHSRFRGNMYGGLVTMNVVSKCHSVGQINKVTP